MIFHTQYTITINRFALAHKFINKVKRVNVPLPKKWINKAFDRLVNSINKVTNKDKGDEILDEKFHALKILQKIDFLKTMYQGLKIAWAGIVDPEMLKMYKDYFKKDFDEKGLMIISNEIRKWTSKYKIVVKGLQPVQPNEPFDIDELIERINTILHPRYIGEEKLYMLPYFIDKADKIKKLKEKE